jgi:uncharacterized protein (DUF433 family)
LLGRNCRSSVAKPSRPPEKRTKILDNYTGIAEEDILACIAYGAEMSRERYVDIPVKQTA